MREPFRKTMLKRTKRIRKYEKKLQEMEEEVPINFSSKFLDSVSSNTETYEASYSTTQHDIFGEHDQKVQEEVDRMARECVEGVSVLQIEKRVLKEIEGLLVVDFDEMDEEDVILSYRKLVAK